MSCGSLANLNLTSGTASYSVTTPNMSCLALAAPLTATFTIAWNTGQTSTVTISHLSIAGASLLTGSVTSGLFAGRQLTIATTGLSATMPIECLAGGLSRQTGTATLDVS